MNFKSTLLAFAAFAPATLWAQWTKLTSGTTKELKTVYFANESTGWVAGEDGTVRKTTDGGAAWSALTSGTTKDVNGMFFIDASTGWIVGKDGMVRKTTDRGTTWVAQTSGTSNELAAVHFIDASNGVAVGEGGVVISTTDGGSNWTANTSGHKGTDDDEDNDNDGGDDDEFRDLNDVQMIDANTVYACGKEGVFIKSTNHGSTWSLQASGTTSDLNSLHFPTSSKGYTCYKAGGVRHTNGSGTFTSITAPTSKDLNGVHFVSDAKGWVVGDEGRILCTTNGGTSWVTQNLSSVTSDLYAVYFPSASTGYAVGKSGVILKSSGGSNGSVAGITSLAAESVFSIYPNPTEGMLNIALNDANTGNEISLNISDVSGRTIKSVSASVNGHTTAISTNGISAGIYFVNIACGEQNATLRFEKK